MWFAFVVKKVKDLGETKEEEAKKEMFARRQEFGRI